MSDQHVNGWRLMRLVDAMDAIIDYRGKTPQKVANGIPLVTAKIIKNGRIDDPAEFIAPEAYAGWMRRGLPRVGDVLLTTEAPLGEVAQLRDDRIALAQRVILLRGRSGLLSNSFLKYLLQSRYVQDQLHGRGTGTTATGISQKDLREVTLPVPPYEQQIHIAAALAALDEKVESNRRINRTLECMASALFGSWFVDFEPVVAKAAGRVPSGIEASLAVQFPREFRDTPAGPAPVAWASGAITDVAEIRGGGTPKTDEPAYWSGLYPWFSVVDVPNSSDVFVIHTEKTITDRGLRESAAELLPPGTTIVTARGTVGKVAMAGVPMAINQSCYGLVPKPGYGPYFCHLMVRELVDELQQMAHGSVFETITRATLRDIKIVVPPPEVASAFEETVRPWFEQIRANVYECITLAETRERLLPKLMAGELQLSEANE